MKYFFDVITSFGFIFFVVLFGVITIGNRYDFSLNDGRNSEAWPVFQLKSSVLKDFPKKFDSAFSDHFFLREQCIFLSRGLKYYFFNLSDNKSVIFGDQKWLFLNDEVFMGSKFPIDPESHAEKWANTIEARYRWSLSQGINYYFVLAPNKNTIYPNYLPSIFWYKGIRPSDLLVSKLIERGVPALDLKVSLAELGKREQIYLNTDTHWNYLGSYYGAFALVEYISGKFKGFPSLVGYDRNWSGNSEGGDLARILGISWFFKETQQISMVKKFGKYMISQTSDLIPDIYLNNGTNSIHKMVGSNSTGIIGVVFCDSFCRSWELFLSDIFDNTFFYSTLFFDEKFLLKTKPQFVIQGIVERNIDFITAPDASSFFTPEKNN